MRRLSIDEVDTESMKDQTAEDEVRKRPFRANLVVFNQFTADTVDSLCSGLLRGRRRTGGRSLRCLHS